VKIVRIRLRTKVTLERIRACVANFCYRKQRKHVYTSIKPVVGKLRPAKSFNLTCQIFSILQSISRKEKTRKLGVAGFRPV